MSGRRRGILLGISLLVGLVVPWVPAAQAADSFRIQLDAAPPQGEPWSFQRYFPASLQVHQGDVVEAAWGGVDPHTATAIPSNDPAAWRAANQGPGGVEDPADFPWALQVPDGTVGGDDNEVVVNPAVLFPTSPTCGTSTNPCPFDGTSVTSSGFMFGNPASEPSFFFRMDAPPGTYSFVCLLHPGMQESVTVAPASATIPDPTAVASKITRQIRRTTKVDGTAADAQAQTVSERRIAGGHHRWTISAGGFSNGVSANEYNDNGLTVDAGDQVKVVGNFEIHTATVPRTSVRTTPFTTSQCEVTGPDTPAASPADCTDPTTFQVAFNPQAVLPTKRNDLARRTRFVNSGLIVNPQTFTFDAVKPGVYTLVCLVHGPIMRTTITVK